MSLMAEMKREENRDKFWDLVKTWDNRRIANHIVDNLPPTMVDDIINGIEAMPEEIRTPKEVFDEASKRRSLLDRLTRIVGEDFLDIDRDRLIKEMSLEAQIPALEQFVTHLEQSGDEVCSTWRSKLVTVNCATKDGKIVVYGYFKSDIDTEEMMACHRAYLRQNDWDFETDIPEGYNWNSIEEPIRDDNAVSKNAGWFRYQIGKLS